MSSVPGSCSGVRLRLLVMFVLYRAQTIRQERHTTSVQNLAATSLQNVASNLWRGHGTCSVEETGSPFMQHLQHFTMLWKTFNILIIIATLWNTSQHLHNFAVPCNTATFWNIFQHFETLACRSCLCSTQRSLLHITVLPCVLGFDSTLPI